MSDETKDRIMKDSAAGLIDVVIVRDNSVIALDDRILEKLENDCDFPLVIGAEDLYYTREDFDFESFRFAHKTKEESGKAETSTAGTQLYGYIKRCGYQSIDRKTSKVVLEIFDAARSGCNPAVIRRRLDYMQIPTPNGGKKWSRQSVVNILRNARYCGDENTEQLIRRTVFDQVQEVLAENRRITLDEPFPMAVCDVCNSKLRFQRAEAIERLKTSSYLCDKHVGQNPTKSRLEKSPKISVDDLTAKALAACNEFLDREESLKGDIERGQKVVALGKKTLDSCAREGENLGLWNSWLKERSEAAKLFGRELLRYHVGHMAEYDPKVGERIIRSLRLKADGTVEIGLWGDEIGKE